MTEHVRSLARGLAVLRAFDGDAPVQTLSDVARRTGLTRAATRRFLLTLAELGYVRADGRQFRLTPKVLELGFAYLSALTLPEVAGPHLEALSAEVHESVSMTVLDGVDVVHVAGVATSRVMSAAMAIGTRLPAHATASGRVLLPGHRDDVAAGYCLVDDELELGVRSIAVPVQDAGDVVVAAVTVSTRPGRADLERDVLPRLRACVAAIEADVRSGSMQP